MKKIADAVRVLKPWFDDPETHEIVVERLRSAAHAGHLRTSPNPQARAKGDEMLTLVSEGAMIPRSVLETYGEGIAALNSREGFEWLMSKIGGVHDE
ncbi:hypothetical protein ACLKMY_18420 [Paraburkholderia mimosarum]|uniref:hypothetical protein n=1 Tax=Paraburkholderia mimosarum TaxID=312026 RepID=UPI0039C1BADC